MPGIGNFLMFTLPDSLAITMDLFDPMQRYPMQDARIVENMDRETITRFLKNLFEGYNNERPL